MRGTVALLVLAARLALPALVAGEVPEQTVTPITPRVEQRVEALTPPGEQRVETVDPADMQRVLQGTNPEKHGPLATAGKVVVGVMAAAVSIGVMLASLLLI